MSKIYKYIVVESHVWSEWHMCDIVSLLRFFSRPLTGPPRHQTLCPLFGAVSRAGLPELQETGHSVTCEPGWQGPLLKAELPRECLVLLSPGFQLGSAQPRSGFRKVCYHTAAQGDWGERGGWGSLRGRNTLFPSLPFISEIDFVYHLTSLCAFILVMHDLNLVLTSLIGSCETSQPDTMFFFSYIAKKPIKGSQNTKS